MKPLLFLFACLPSLLIAHAGCHEAPGAERAPHGGILEHTDNILVELVDTEDPMKIYVLDGHLHPIPTQNLKVEGSVQIPRRRGHGQVEVGRGKDHFTAQVQLSGRVHRYTLQLVIDTPESRETVKFQLEP